MKFRVIRQHIGDKLYMPGDYREADEADVKHLVGKVLEKDEPKTKVERNPRNKAENGAPGNKAE